MRDIDDSRVEPQRATLGLDRRLELRRRRQDARDAGSLQLGDVVHTARRARSSIGEGFDHRVTLGPDLAPQISRRRLGVCGLAKTGDLQSAPAKDLIDPIEEDVAPDLRDVEQPDSEPIERCRSRRARAASGLALPSRIEELGHGRTSRVTGSVPAGPLTHPPMMAENSPAVPPAFTNSKPPGRNFWTLPRAAA